MKILIICRRYIPGEAWTNRILAYAKGFAEQGVDVELCFLIGDKIRNPYEIIIPGVKVIDFWQKDNAIERKIRYLSYCRNLIRCRHYVNNDDNVFLYGIDPFLPQIVLHKTKNVFVEITEHPYKKGVTGEKKLTNNRVKLINQFKGLFVISRALREYFIKNGIEQNKVYISNMFVDTGRFDILGTDSQEPYFAYCGVVSKYKDGVDILLKSFALFHKEYPIYKIFIIGRFESNEVENELELLTEELGIKQNVVFTGLVSPDNMPQLLCNAQALVLARPDNLQSQYGFPTKLGEYLATGKPVIATSVGEIGEFIKNKENGVLVNPNDVNAFFEGMKWVVEHPNESTLIGKKGQQLALNEFSYKTQSQKVIEVMLRNNSHE